MHNKYDLNIDTSWKNLPWQKIYFRILIIQKKIFQAMQQYNLKKLYKLQKVLLNSHEAKIFSIKTIFSKYYIYSNRYNHSQYNLKDKKKFIIFKMLYRLNNQHKFYLITEQIKQYILFLCIEPEWKAKFINFYYINNNIQINNLNSVNYKYCSSKYIHELPFNIKYVFTNKIIKKIQSDIFINNSIQYWLYNNYYINLNNSFHIIYKNCIILNIKHLYNLMSNISLVGLDWYIFHLYEVNYFFTNEKKINVINNCYVKLYISLLNTIKLRLYRKNILNKLKLNKHINNYRLCNNLNHIINIYLNFYITKIYLTSIELLYQKINIIIYFWYKKQSNNIYYQKLIKNNLFLNKLLSISIIKNNYINQLFY